MSLCINPSCTQPQNRDDELFCQTCGSELLLKGRYRVMRQLGGGGFGLTFEVNEVRSNTAKVLKVLINTQQKAVDLFQQEAEVLSQLDNPGIPQVEGDGYFVYFPRNSPNPVHCLVMEKIVGMDLEKYMHKRELRPIDQDLAMQWLKELVIILEDVHSQNFFHRDIKPPNIMLRATGELTLIDFGTARQVTATVVNQQGGVTMISSAGYTPVEQMNSQAVPQSDFFALGRTFIYLLTGKYPLDSAIYDAHNDEIAWRIHAPHISPLLADLLDEMMAHKPKQRPANTQMILQRLAEIKQALNPPKVTRRTNPPGVAPTQPVNTPQPKVIVSTSTQPKSFWQEVLKVANTPIITPTQSVNTPQPPVTISTLSQAKPVGWGFWLQWVLANIVGCLVFVWFAFRPSIYIGGFLFSHLFPRGAVDILLSVTFWGGIQWLTLRQLFTCKWWVLLTVLGGIIGFVVGGIMMVTAYRAWGLTDAISISVGGAVFGASLGVMQWLVLKRQVSRAEWWIIANAVGFIGIWYSVYFTWSLAGTVLTTVACTFFSAITGGTLVWLMRQPAVKH
ncbi:protein kinase [Anabaena minutissima FACHB-250]|nr:protein kinase [Anabaena minutissima FACHB-250]